MTAPFEAPGRQACQVKPQTVWSAILSSGIEMNAIGALSKYRIITKLGAGGMGGVYKGEDLVLLRSVAIKVMSKQETRFLLEARAASAFNHPNIVTIYEIGETDEHTYIVMEYVEGRSLRELISKKQLRAEKVLDIAMQICDALYEAHTCGIIHRDIKPENILVSDRGQVKLVDFGLAKTVSPKARIGGARVAESLTESGTVMGTLSYMSPEQLRGEPLDHRTDIFSFGVVLHEMVTGDLPFPGSNSFEVASSILKDPALEIGTVPPELPRDIRNVVARLLRKSRNDRYSSFAEVKSAIEALDRSLQSSNASSDNRSTVEMQPSSSSKRSASLAASLRSSSRAQVKSTKVQNYLEEKLVWQRTTDPHYPYNAEFDGERCVLRLNDFPEDHLYTLLVDEAEVASFDDWPDHWNRA